MSENKRSEPDSELLREVASSTQSAAPSEAESGDPVPEWLQKGLKKLYGNVMEEAVPDEFARLLKQLEEKERS